MMRKVLTIGNISIEVYATYEDTNMALMSVLYAAIGAGVAAVALGDNGKAQVAATDMFELLDTPSEIDGLEPVGITPPSSMQPGNIEFKDQGDCCFVQTKH